MEKKILLAGCLFFTTIVCSSEKESIASVFGLTVSMKKSASEKSASEKNKKSLAFCKALEPKEHLFDHYLYETVCNKIEPNESKVDIIDPHGDVYTMNIEKYRQFEKDLLRNGYSVRIYTHNYLAVNQA